MGTGFRYLTLAPWGALLCMTIMGEISGLSMVFSLMCKKIIRNVLLIHSGLYVLLLYSVNIIYYSCSVRAKLLSLACAKNVISMFRLFCHMRVRRHRG